MRHTYVVGNSFVTLRSFVSAVLAAMLLLCGTASIVSADTMFRWQDADGRIHFSNRSGRVPTGARVASLPKIGVVKRPQSARSASASPASAVVASSEVRPGRFVVACEAPDTSGLIGAVTTSLPPVVTEGQGGQDPDLTLFVAAQPISYPRGAELLLLPGGDWNDVTAAVAQGAVAYPASGGCPQTPPLERYAVDSGPSRAPSSSRCDDFRSAFAEVEIALHRNENVADTFEVASRRFSDVAMTDGVFRAIGMDVALPTWLAQVNAAQTAELAAETQELLNELSVARDEIDRAAQASDCW